MKTKFSFLILLSALSFLYSPCAAQVPLGFNYQAIARNESGPITDPITVKITILSKITPPEVVVYDETHSSVDPDENGLFSIVVGQGTPTTGSFAAINWGVAELYLRTTIGTDVLTPDTRLWSVPYTMVADNVVQPLDVLKVTGTSSSETEAIFEVRNNLGKSVLSVYNDGVSIHVGPQSKGAKGGFSVGGFDNSKDIVGQRYLFADPAGVNVFIDDNPLKGAKGGFSVGGFESGKLGLNFLDISVDVPELITEVNRILWYPLKNAFLTGKVSIASVDDVGENSFASGFKAKAKGMYSQSMGYLTNALGDYSTAIGKNALANNNNSFAFGDGAKAMNNDSYAFGALTEAQGIGSFAFGYTGRDSLGATGSITKAVGNYSFALGLGAQTGASAEGAFAIGSGTNAAGKFSLAMGYKSSASEYYSVAIGNSAVASGSQAFAIGSSSDAIGTKSLAIFGYADGLKSIAIGEMARSYGSGSVAIGGYMTGPPTIVADRASAEGYRSIAFGSGVRAVGNRSVSIGTGQYGEFLIPAPPIFPGTANANYSYAIGTNNISDATYAFAIGTGSTASGTSSYAIGENITTTGQYATAMGYSTTAQAYNSFVIGRFNKLEGSTSAWNDTEPLFVIGNGSSTSARANAFMVKKNGVTETGSTLRVMGWDVPPTTGAGVEISYLGGGSIQAYDRTAGTPMPLSVYSGTVRPMADNTYSCGHASYKWTAVYAVNGTIQTSDQRLKDKIKPLTGGLLTVMKLNPVSFNWKNQPDGNRYIGLIAQEVAPLIPQVVDTGDDPDKTLGINYAGLVPVLVNAIQEQQKQIDELKSLVNKLISEKE